MGSPEADEALESFGPDIGRQGGPLIQFREWVLVGGDRLLVAVLLSAVAFAFFLALERGGLVGFSNDDSMTRLASGLTAGTFSLVTVVVSVNQLILSQEFVSAGESREVLEGVRDFRQDLADATGVPASPASPTGMLELLAETIHRRADALAASVADHDDEEVRDLVTRYADRVTESTDRMDDTLEHASFGSFQAVSAAIRYDSAWQLYVAAHLSNRYRGALSEESLEALDALVDDLELFEVAQEHFKTTYLQRELTRFSQLTVYAGVPGIVSAVVLALLYAEVGGAAISPEYLPLVASTLVAVVLLSVGLLASFILRTATVTRRTASIGPMLPQKDPREGPFSVSAEGRDE